MIEFIIKNKEWIFSGIGVFFIAGIISLLRIIFKKRQQSLNTPLFAPASGPSSVYAGPADIVNVVGPKSISPDEIKTAYCSVPLLQRTDVARQYQGLRVQWKGELYCIEMMSDEKAKIEIKWQNSAFGIFFTLDSVKYKGMGILKRGDLLTVNGKIKDVSEFYISLTAAKLIPEPESSAKAETNLKEEEALIMEALKNITSPDDALACKEISEIVGLDVPTTEYFLNQLKSAGFVDGPYITGIGRHYMLTEKGFQRFYEMKQKIT